MVLGERPCPRWPVLGSLRTLAKRLEYRTVKNRNSSVLPAPLKTHPRRRSSFEIVELRTQWSYLVFPPGSLWSIHRASFNTTPSTPSFAPISFSQRRRSAQLQFGSRCSFTFTWRYCSSVIPSEEKNWAARSPSPGGSVTSDSEVTSSTGGGATG
jgi:hypothetical protein